MLDKKEMKLAMLNSETDTATSSREPPFKSICRTCRTPASSSSSTSSLTPNPTSSLNSLVKKLDERLNSGKRTDSIDINRVLENAIHWCLVNGFVLVPRERQLTEKLVVTYLPFTFLPSVLERDHFNQVVNLQPHINQVVYKLANSPDFLENAFEGMIEIDEFLSSLWNIYKKALSTGYNQHIHLVILRTDYMLNECENNSTCMKQVEVNTISAGFGYVGGRACQLHDEILKWFGVERDVAHMRAVNQPLASLAQGFVQAWRLYNSPRAVVIFIVLDYEINIADQRHLEYEITKNEPGIEVVRCTLADLDEFGHLRDDMTLFYDEREVAIVYYRAGYDPSHYKSQREWDALLKIERSKAVKCPTVGAFLAGMKKIQEYISHEENLAEICDHKMDVVKSLKASFVDFFKLDSKENIEKVYKNPEKYVLKPQREGGGNNLYNSQIKTFLEKLMSKDENENNNERVNQIENESSSSPSLSHHDHANLMEANKDIFIVMEKIQPTSSENYIISAQSQTKMNDSQNKLVKTRINNELGIFGVLVRNGDQIVMNETAGYCLRSKPENENESGVMCGSGALDSLILVD